MSLDLRKRVADFLANNAGKRFTAREIALWLFNSFPHECQEKKRNSKTINTDAGLITQLVSEIGAHRPTMQKHNPQIKITQEKPRRYYWEDHSNQDVALEPEETEPEIKPVRVKETLQESDLYPLLSKYLYQMSTGVVYSKRIDEKKGSNKQAGGNRWLYPDLVGVEDITGDWHRKVKELAEGYSDKKTRLWSFEVKKNLNRGNVREAYFQAVSNSSWANLGYLAATSIQEGDTMKELRMLFSRHGIGVIKIDHQKPAASQIILPAQERTDVDWDTCSRLTKENDDFLQYMDLIHDFYLTGKLRPRDWDVPNS